MLKKKFIFLAILGIFFAKSYAEDPSASAVVNFSQCITDSKYGKYEQEQLEKIKGQWSTLIEGTEKELKELSEKFEDQDYLDGLSPEAEEEMKTKYRSLNEDMNKYQNQLYQVLNQANYFFIQKMSNNISQAAEMVAKEKKLDVVLNKEACFYCNPDMEVTSLVISEMDKTFENQKISENEQNQINTVEEQADAAKDNEKIEQKAQE